MPKLLRAPPKDLGEERQVRKLAGSRHAPGDWIQRARMIARSWDGARTTQIAAELGCHPQTVRERIWRLPPRAWAGWGPARRRAPTAADQAPAQPAHRAGADRPAGPLDPPGRWSPGGPTTSATRPTGPWMGSPAPLTGWASGSSAARCARSCLASGSAGAHPAPGQQRRPDFAAKNPGRRALHPPAQGRDGRLRRRARPGDPRTFPPAPGWSPDGHRVKAPLEYGRGEERVWCTARCGSSGPTRPGSSRWSATTCPATTAGRCGRGWPTTPHPAGIYPEKRLLAAPAGGLVAAVSPCGLGRPVVANAGELEHATRVATRQLNRRARPWCGAVRPADPQTPPQVRVPPLRNAALIVGFALKATTRPQRQSAHRRPDHRHLPGPAGLLPGGAPGPPGDRPGEQARGAVGPPPRKAHRAADLCRAGQAAAAPGQRHRPADHPATPTAASTHPGVAQGRRHPPTLTDRRPSCSVSAHQILMCGTPG